MVGRGQFDVGVNGLNLKSFFSPHEQYMYLKPTEEVKAAIVYSYLPTGFLAYSSSCNALSTKKIMSRFSQLIGKLVVSSFAAFSL